MKFFSVGLAVFGSLAALAVTVALVLVASSPPQPRPQDVFRFDSLRTVAVKTELPALKRYPARDGEELAYRIYDSPSDRVLIFAHGSSYHGAGYHALAAFISESGIAKVVLPNLRGHFQSGRRRGDTDYIGQLEDDLADLIAFLRREGMQGPIVLGGHSSGGGLAIRFAGGIHAGLVSNFLVLSPVIPTSPAVRGGTAGGWASMHLRRLFGLVALNAIGIRGFNALPIVTFSKPVAYWDGTETLSYSYRLNVSYHPRYRYAEDIRAMDGKALVLVGDKDEAVDADALRAMFSSDAPRVKVVVPPGIDHFAIFTDPAALGIIVDWLRGLPR